jgi:putative drug exporter of the RND superfamily
VATFLYRIGRVAYRRAWLVIVAWMLVLAAALGGGLALGGETDEAFSIPGTESQEALDQLEQLFPAAAGASAQAVVVAPEGASVTDPDIRSEIADLAADLAAIDGVSSVLGPFDEFADGQISDDESVAIVRAQLSGSPQEVMPATLDEIIATGADRAVRVEFAGQVFQDTTVGITVSEVIGLLVAGAVLLITFGSLRAAGMPLVTAIVGVSIVMGAILALSAFVSVSSSAPLLALMIGLAVGIDYALFILSRHRTQLARGMDPAESAAVAVGTAGSAVVFAGLTVMIALLGLLVVGIPFLSVMGIGAAFAVLVAIAGAVTLLPALLGLAGSRLAPREGSRAWLRAQPEQESARTMGRRWVRGVMKRPVLTTIAVVTVLGTLSLPAFSLDLNLPDGGNEPAGSTQREAYDLIADAFGPGTAGPLLVTVDITQTTEILEDLRRIRAELDDVAGVASVSPGIPSPGLELAIFRVAPETAPDARETKTVVADLRAAGVEIAEKYGTPIAVTGTTAVGIDISTRITAALIPFVLIVMGLSIVLLMAVFRSVLVPVKAALGFLLTVGTGLGVSVAVFQWGWGAELLHTEAGPILSFMPIILMAVLFGLAMDYEVFLVSGMREEFVRTGDAHSAIEDGFAHGARVVTAAALIMFFVFAAFVPEGSNLIKPIALGLAVGIAVDAFIVRMTLGPAIMTLLGRAGWWFPRGLDRAMPDLDIEGERLRHHRDDALWAVAHPEAVIVTDDLQIDGTNAVLSLRAEAGDRVALITDARTRRLAAGTLAGILPPHGGRARIAGALLPSEANRVIRKVSIADLSGAGLPSTITVGELVSGRLGLLASAERREPSRRTVDRWLEHVAASASRRGLAISDALSADAPIAALTTVARATLLAAVATLDATPVIVLDHPGDQLDSATMDRLDDLVRDLAGPSTVRVWGATSPPQSPHVLALSTEELVR